jgi:hypothetical protein
MARPRQDAEQPLRRQTRVRRWAVGAVVAGLGVSITNMTTGLVSATLDRLSGLVETKHAPVQVTVAHAIDAHRLAGLGSAHWLFTRPIRALVYPSSGDLTSADTWDAWARRNGGIDSDVTGIRVVIVGRDADPIVLTDLMIEVTRRMPAPRGVNIAPFGGSAFPNRWFQVNLDATPVTVESLLGDDPTSPAVRFPYRISRTDPEEFVILASTQRYDTSWVAHLKWVYHGENGETRIDDHGKPFRTAASSRSVTYVARDGTFTKQP